MVGPKLSSVDDLAYLRKVRKPMVEKKRRERMNHSISQLKSLIAQTIQEHTAPITRVDKADILELTVYHLSQLQQQQQRPISMATEAASYNRGYKDCAREAVAYLTRNKVTHAHANGLSNHLLSSYLVKSRREQSVSRLPCNPSLTNKERFNGRLSTPVRRPGDSFNTSLPELNLSEYSPILNGTQSLPELTYNELNSTSSQDYSTDNSGASVSPSSSFQSYSEHSTDEDSRTEYQTANICIDVVTIGDGKENEIGHVIKEVLWRPF